MSAAAPCSRHSGAGPPATRLFAGYVVDLDGTVYLGDELLPGAVDDAREDPRRPASGWSS